MEEEVKQDTSETETQEKRNTEECEETAEASAENTETPEDGEASEEKDKKGFFSGRKKEKKEDAVKAQINELQDKVMRQMAEFENFRKRSEKEKSAMFETGANSSLTKRNPLTETGNFGKEKPPLWLYPYTAEYIVLGQHLLLLYKKLFTFRYLQIQTILRQPH